MRKSNALLTIGLIIFSMPFLGIPESWKALLLFVLGALVILIAFAFRFEMRKLSTDETAIFHEESEPELEETHIEPLDGAYMR